MDVKACLQITMKIKTGNRNAAAKVYSDFREPFLARIPGSADQAIACQKRGCPGTARF